MIRIVIILAVFAIVATLIGLYAHRCIKKVAAFYGADIKSKKWKIINIILAVLVALCCVNMWSVSILIVMHILAIFAVMDLIAYVVRKIFKNKNKESVYKCFRAIYRCGFIPVLITAILGVYGYINMQNIVRTEYTMTSDKLNNSYKVVMLSDTHYDTIQDPNILKEKIKVINEEHPDIILLAGDIVEEGTSNESMRDVFKSLGQLEAKYGIYYVYGNHDRQSYSNNKAYTVEELENTIIESGIEVLKDKSVNINDDLVIVGRDDAAWGNTSDRKDASELLKDVDINKYIIMMDHQPIEAKENSELGVDLEVSGHTHAGQIWPIGMFNELVGTLNYGEYNIDKIKVIVTSGFTGWGYPIRTQGHCEYVVMNINCGK